MRHTGFFLFAVSSSLAGIAAFSACSAGREAPIGSGGGGGADGTGGTGGSSAAFNPAGSGAGDCVSGDNDVDHDGDGWTRSQGDCNDCDKNVNPGALEVIAEPDDKGNVPDPADENCDHQIDNVTGPCDAGLALDDKDAMNGARAIGLCQIASPNGTKGMPGYASGVVDASYTSAKGKKLNPGQQVGIMDSFGFAVGPKEGEKLLVLSSGRARTPGQEGQCKHIGCDSHSGDGAPPGFPAKVPHCDGGQTAINDDIALQLVLRAPTNATGYRFDFKFYSFEYPEFVCSPYNDQFIAYVLPHPAGSVNGNISFDSKGNPVSVNLGFFDVCDKSTAGQWPNDAPPIPDPYCPSGAEELQGTGFDYIWDNKWGGATSWLRTAAPISGGEQFTLRFAIWDTGDDNYDSTVLVDNFSWIAGAGVVVGTNPTPN